MEFVNKIKSWISNNKEKIIVGGTVVLSIIGCVLYNDSETSSYDWLSDTSTEDLREAYEKERLEFCRTGIRSPAMERLNRELGERGAKEWFEKHPPNTDPNFRWTDANRWDKD